MVALAKRYERAVEERCERRLFLRKQISLSVEALRLDHSLMARRCPRAQFTVGDLSVSGLSGVSDVPLLAGERLSVFIPGRGFDRGWDAYGRVVRCEPGLTGYRIAVEFDPLPAA